MRLRDLIRPPENTSAYRHAHSIETWAFSTQGALVSMAWTGSIPSLDGHSLPDIKRFDEGGRSAFR